MKILKIHAQTYGNETEQILLDVPSLQAALCAGIPANIPNLPPASDVIRKLNEEGRFEFEDSLNEYMLLSVMLWPRESIFGTDFATVQVWEEPEGCVYDRYNDTYIVLPEDVSTVRKEGGVTDGSEA